VGIGTRTHIGQRLGGLRFGRPASGTRIAPTEQVPLVFAALTAGQRQELRDILNTKGGLGVRDAWAQLGRACGQVATDCAVFGYPQVMLAVAARRAGLSRRTLRAKLMLRVPRRPWKLSRLGYRAFKRDYARKVDDRIVPNYM